MSIVYDCINIITGMYPTNPANTKAKFKCLDLINKASSPLLYSLSCLNYEEHERAKDYALEALDILNKR